MNMAESIRIGPPTCNVNVHLNYVTATGIDVWNGDPEHVISVIPNFNNPDIKKSVESIMAARRCHDRKHI